MHNICSITKHFEKLCIYTDWRVLKLTIILTAYWLGLQNFNANNFKIARYKTYFTNETKNQNDGVFILYSNEIRSI